MTNTMTKEAMDLEAKAYNLNSNGNNNNTNGKDLAPDDDDDECTDRKCYYYEFKEYATVMKLIDNLAESTKVLRDGEKSFDQFSSVCNHYQEQPHLIDPFLLEIFQKLIVIVKKCNSDTTTNDKLINECFKYMHCLAKMRGYKKIVQYLPFEINDFEPVLNLLARQNLNDVYSWQTRYLLLLWLSIVCMVPIDLKQFDANNQNKSESIINRLLDTCIVRRFLLAIL